MTARSTSGTWGRTNLKNDCYLWTSLRLRQGRCRRLHSAGVSPELPFNSIVAVRRSEPSFGKRGPRKVRGLSAVRRTYQFMQLPRHHEEATAVWRYPFIVAPSLTRALLLQMVRRGSIFTFCFTFNCAPFYFPFFDCPVWRTIIYTRIQVRSRRPQEHLSR